MIRGCDKVKHTVLSVSLMISFLSSSKPFSAEVNSRKCTKVDIDKAYLAKVAADTHFVDSPKHACLDGKTCSSSPDVGEGITVISNGNNDGFACSMLMRADKRVSIGWLKSSSLSPIEVKRYDRKDWGGKWKSWPDNQILVEDGGSKGLAIKGSASYPSGKSINTGDVAGLIQPVGDRLSFAVGAVDEAGNGQITEDADGEKVAALPYDTPGNRCRLKLRLLFPYLLAEDNGLCGGYNVTFTGVYMRAGAY